MWDTSSDGRVIMAVNESIRIELLDSGRALVRIITRTHEVKQFTERDQRIFLAAMRDLFEQQGAPAAAIDAAMARFQFADTYPAFITLTHGPQGSVWVQRFAAATRSAKRATSIRRTWAPTPGTSTTRKDGTWET